MVEFLSMGKKKPWFFFISATSHAPFSTAKNYQLIFKNLNMVCMWRSLSDKSMTVYLSKKIFPDEPKLLAKAFQTTYDLLGSYEPLILDTDQSNPLSHKFSLKTRCLPFRNKEGKLEHCPIYFRWKDIGK